MTRLVILTIALTVATVSAGSVAQARERHVRHRAIAVSDLDRTLAHMAERDSFETWPRWKVERSLASYIPPLTRERFAAPPLTGWGYGGTIPGRWPGF